MSLDASEKEILFSKNCFELSNWVTTHTPTLDPLVIGRLLTALPDIDIENEKAFVSACKAYFRIRQAEYFFQQDKSGLEDFLVSNLAVEDWQTAVPIALQHLIKNFHRFQGKTRGEFLVWASKRLLRLSTLKHCATLRDYLNIRIEDFEKILTNDSAFTYTEHSMPFGKEYHIPLETEDGEVIWRVLDLDWAKSLLPVAVKKIKGKNYIVKVVQGHTIFVHRLLFRIGIYDVICAHDDDYLNFSLYPFSQHVEAYWGDWQNPKKTAKSKLIRAQGTKPIYTMLKQEWVKNLYIAHDTQANPAARDEQAKFEKTCMLQPIEVMDDDGSRKNLEFGGWSDGYVSTADISREVRSGKNSPANREHLDKEDRREASAVQKEMRPELERLERDEQKTNATPHF
jgi:hypothetical protein